MNSSLRAQLGAARDQLFPRTVCKKKQRYSSASTARIVMRKRQLVELEKLHIYPCPECHGWHLTKMEQGST